MHGHLNIKYVTNYFICAHWKRKSSPNRLKKTTNAQQNYTHIYYTKYHADGPVSVESKKEIHVRP